MASTTSNPIPFITSSPDDNFVPRKEFVSSSARQFSSFALLSLSSNNVIRLTNFDHNVFNELKARLHSVIGLRAFRENPEYTLGEIILLDKPWSNARFLSTEIVLVQVFAILLRFDYSFVSQIDYGREANDRVTLVFSRPNARTAVYPEGNKFPSQSGATSFGLSFTSATSLRVVCSPLTGTPAILQSIRGSWPKGVKSEKKIGEQCYEFKLKGYSWFQEDTFGEDAPRHILTILSSLDKYSWSLITSLSLSSGRSRTKDFWIFASHPEAPLHEHIQSVSLVNLGTPLKRDQFEPIEDGFNGSDGSNTAAHSTEDLTVPEPRVNELSHYKSNSSLNHSSLDRNLKPSNRSGHLRASSDVTGLNISRETGHLKPQMHQQPPLAAPVPIPILHTASFLIDSPSEPTPSTGRQPPTHSLISLPKDAEDEPHPRTDPNTNTTIDLVPTTGDHDHNTRSPSRIDDPPVLPFSPLLVPNAFRTPIGIEDIRSSVASHSSEKSFEVPITWVPHDTNGDKDGQLVNPFADYEPKKTPPSAFSNNPTAHGISTSTETSDASVNDPVLPGGWVNTPPTDVIQDPLQTERNTVYTNLSNSLNGTLQRNPDLLKEPTANSIVSSSPQIIRPTSRGANRPGHEPTRKKSEFAIVSTVPQPEVVPPVPSRPDFPAEDVSEGKDTGSWVVVSRRIFPDPPTPITAVDSNDSKEDLQQPDHGMGSKSGTLTSSGAVHFVNQSTPAKESPKGSSPRKRRPSIIARLLPSRKEDDDEQASIASGGEKKSRQKPKKLLHGRSRK